MEGSSGDLCFSSASPICVSAGVSCLLLLCLVGPATVLLTMGQGSSTPLSLMIDHFSDFRTKAHNLSMEVKKNKLITLCSAEWLTFSVDWPRERTFDLQTIQAVKHRVLSSGPYGHSDQSPYILVWHSMVKDPPKWLKPFLSQGSQEEPQILVTKTQPEKGKSKPAVFQDSSPYPSLSDLEAEAAPPPYVPQPGPRPHSPEKGWGLGDHQKYIFGLCPLLLAQSS